MNLNQIKIRTMNMWIVTDSGNQLFYFYLSIRRSIWVMYRPQNWCSYLHLCELLEPHMKKISTHKICMSSISHRTVFTRLLKMQFESWKCKGLSYKIWWSALLITELCGNNHIYDICIVFYAEWTYFALLIDSLPCWNEQQSWSLAVISHVPGSKPVLAWNNVPINQPNFKLSLATR